MKTKPSIDEIIESFEEDTQQEERVRDGTTLTFWVSTETKEKYDAIQRRSSRRASKKLKEVMEISIDRMFEASAG